AISASTAATPWAAANAPGRDRAPRAAVTSGSRAPQPALLHRARGRPNPRCYMARGRPNPRCYMARGRPNPLGGWPGGFSRSHGTRPARSHRARGRPSSRCYPLGGWPGGRSRGRASPAGLDGVRSRLLERGSAARFPGGEASVAGARWGEERSAIYRRRRGGLPRIWPGARPDVTRSLCPRVRVGAVDEEYFMSKGSIASVRRGAALALVSAVVVLNAACKKDEPPPPLPEPKPVETAEAPLELQPE